MNLHFLFGFLFLFLFDLRCHRFGSVASTTPFQHRAVAESPSSLFLFFPFVLLLHRPLTQRPGPASLGARVISAHSLTQCPGWLAALPLTLCPGWLAGVFFLLFLLLRFRFFGFRAFVISAVVVVVMVVVVLVVVVVVVVLWWCCWHCCCCWWWWCWWCWCCGDFGVVVLLLLVVVMVVVVLVLR